MTTLTPFRIPVADLVRRPGASRSVHVAAPLADMGVLGSAVPADAPITADLTFDESTTTAEQVQEAIEDEGYAVTDAK